MKIEVKNLKHSESLSEETHAYTATIYVDGEKAFHASNHGHGGCDLYHRAEGYKGPSEKEINDFLAANEAPHAPFEADPAKRQPYDNGLQMSLELVVGEAIERELGEKEFKRRILGKIAVLGPNGVSTYPAKYKPTPQNLDLVRPKLKAGEALINDGDPEVLRRAKIAYGLKVEDRHSAVLQRLNEKRLTSSDARYLIAKGIGDRGDLIKIAEAGEAAYKAYQDERDAARKVA
jgi:hypothetical protein